MNAASGATGGGMSTNLYAGGVFELDPDEALDRRESRSRCSRSTSASSSRNLWGESIEYANQVEQPERPPDASVDADGVIRLVIAHEDPGVPNWLDTTGQPEGFMAPRWAYSETPPPESAWPSIAATEGALREIREHLPEATRRVSADERRETDRRPQAARAQALPLLLAFAPMPRVPERRPRSEPVIVHRSRRGRRAATVVFATRVPMVPARPFDDLRVRRARRALS